VHWVFSAGSTGESVDLTVAERKAMAAAWVQAAKQYGQRVIVHVGADSVVDARDMAAHAQSVGADAVAAMPPTCPSASHVHTCTLTYITVQLY
jgi:N-acetylneuraminate lyase